MTEAAEPDHSRDIAGLLFKAAQQLPEDEERALVEYFLERGIRSEHAWRQPIGEAAWTETARILRHGGLPERSAMAAHLSEHKVVGGDQVTIPVRLSQAQHKRLKQWCAKHEFPMAVVVRGLIERFLDEWDKPAPA